MKLFVGNLPFDCSDRELRDLVAAHAAVREAKVVRDRESGQSKGFGFVELEMESDADTVIGALGDSSMRGRKLRVERATSQDRNRKPHIGGSPFRC